MATMIDYYQLPSYFQHSLFYLVRDLVRDLVGDWVGDWVGKMNDKWDSLEYNTFDDKEGDSIILIVGL